VQTLDKNIEDIIDTALHHIALTMKCDRFTAEAKVRSILNHREFIELCRLDQKLGEIVDVL